MTLFRNEVFPREQCRIRVPYYKCKEFAGNSDNASTQGNKWKRKRGDLDKMLRLFLVIVLFSHLGRGNYSFTWHRVICDTWTTIRWSITVTWPSLSHRCQVRRNRFFLWLRLARSDFCNARRETRVESKCYLHVAAFGFAALWSLALFSFLVETCASLRCRIQLDRGIHSNLLKSTWFWNLWQFVVSCDSLRSQFLLWVESTRLDLRSVWGLCNVKRIAASDALITVGGTNSVFF